MQSVSPLRVVVQLPGHRPEEPIPDPPKIEWNAKKADILWEVIARSRASDSGGTDWKGLAAHLEVPLPYLLYRAQTRYEEDLRGLQEVKGVLSPSKETGKPGQEFPFPSIGPISTRKLVGSASRLSLSAQVQSPLAMRTRLNSLGQNPHGHLGKAISSSTLTLQGPSKTHGHTRQRSSSTSSSETNSDAETAAKEEEADRRLEEQEILDHKLQQLHKMMTNDTIGLVSSWSKGTEKGLYRGRKRPDFRPTQSSQKLQAEELSSRSQSVSSTSASSPQDSIPSIPSPSHEQPRSPMSRHMSQAKSTSPPAVSPRNAMGQAHMVYRPMIGRTSASEQGSANGSAASSFSDLSDASLSASALESALMSNIRGGGSRISAFARSRLTGRGGGIHH